jgi:epoxide hydrolase 4
VPVLILWAELDEYLLASGLTGIEQLVKDVTIKKVPGANHWLSLEKPGLVAQALREFVAIAAERKRRPPAPCPLNCSRP